MQRVQLDEHPLQLQLRFLQELGHTNPYRMQLEGLKEDFPYMFKFVAGKKAMQVLFRGGGGINGEGSECVRQ